MTVADMYGEESEDTPQHIYDRIRIILTELQGIRISYPDITSYNFMIDEEENVWIIDFGHANYIREGEEFDEFMQSFIEGHNGWNPDFR